MRPPCSLQTKRLQTMRKTHHNPHTHPPQKPRKLIYKLFIIAVLIGTSVLSPYTASASNVWWGPFGYGWFAGNGNNVTSTYKHLDIETRVEPLNERRKKVTYTITFNKDRDGSAFSGITWLFAYLPQSLIDETIRITREHEQTNFGIGGIRYHWQTLDSQQTIGQFNNHDYRSAGLYPQNNFHEDWNKGFGQTHPGDDKTAPQFTSCEVTDWKNNGRFARSLWVQESGKNVRHRWTITAEIDARIDPHREPILAGYNSSNTVSHEDHYMAYGPYDTDNDGWTDIEENQLKTNPFKPDLDYDTIDAEYGEVLVSKPFARIGELNYDAAHGGTWDFKPHPSKRLTKTMPNGTRFTIKPGSLPQSIREVNTPNVQDGEVYVDNTTGEIRYKPKKTHRGKIIDFTINIKYPSTHSSKCKPRREESVTAQFNLIQQNRKYFPRYQDTTLAAGDQATVEPPTTSEAPGHLPYGSRFSMTSEEQRKYPWIKLNTVTGSLELTPSKQVTPQDYLPNITVTYPDESTSTIRAKITVTKANLSAGDFVLRISDKQITLQEGTPFKPELKISAYSRADKAKIGLRLVCQEQGKPTTYQGGINGWQLQPTLIFKPSNDVQEEDLRNGGNRVDGTIYRNDNMIARSDSTVTGVANKVGVYQCAVFAASNIRDLQHAPLQADGNLDPNHYLSGIYDLGRRVSWDSQTFTVRVVKPFMLPKTGETNVNQPLGWIALMSTLITGLWYAWHERTKKSNR